MRKKKRLLWRLYPSYLLITVLSLGVVSAYTYYAVRSFFMAQSEDDLYVRARLLEKQIAGLLDPLNAAAVDRICKESGRRAATRVTVLLPNGEVVGDSDERPAAMDNHHDRPEIKKASAGEFSAVVRYSRTLDKRMMYGAAPVIIDGRIAGVIRTALPLERIYDILADIQSKIVMAGVVMAFIASGVGYLASRRISRPIETMKQGAAQFAGGNFKHRLAEPDIVEMASLSEAMNQMAAQLEDRIRTVVNQQTEIEAILSSMLEGVIAVDAEERILNMNFSAARMFAVDADGFKGRSIQETIRNREMHSLIHATLTTGKTLWRDITVHQDEEKDWNVHSTPLCDANDRRIGALVVLNDVTRLRRLENVRRDFVANVSHEIKTPLTAVKGFVETLRHGGMDDPEEAARFLAIIENHANRLSAIVDDLMLLARVEQGDRFEQIRFEVKPIRDVIEAAIQVCQPEAENKGARFETSCDTALAASIDPLLLEQALVNLLDNAVKYSKDGGRVLVSAETEASEVVIRVADDGMGIPREHLPRLFERFYRVDKARSRKLGGTGLGLAIVKHIAQAHGGRVTVDSALGKGSVFSIYLPAA